MNTLKISVGTQVCRELCELDWEGRIVPRNKSQNFRLDMPLIIKGLDHDKAFSLMTTVIAKVSKEGLPADRWAKEQVVKKLTATRLAEDFTRRNVWRVFTQEELELEPAQSDDGEPGQSRDVPEVTVEVSSSLYEQLLTDATRLKATNKAYEAAKERLYDLATHHLGSGLSSHATEVRALLRFVENCHQCSADGFMAGWYAEKIPCVRESFEDLFRRKSYTHPGYKRAAEGASGRLYSFHAPFAYLGEPPSPHEIKKWIE